MIIYKATNKINGCGYIGQTTDTIDGRWDRHKSSAKRGKKYKNLLVRKVLKGDDQ